MNRQAFTALFAIAAAAICAGLIFLPNVCLLGVDDSFEHNNRLGLIRFLMLSLPGIFCAMIIGFWAKHRRTSRSVEITLTCTVLLGVAIPAPTIYFDDWGDAFILFYPPLSAFAAGILAWSKKSPSKA